MSLVKSFTSSTRNLQKKVGSEFTILLAYILIIVVFSILSRHFFSTDNFLNIGIYSAVTGITATTTTLALVAGCIDISVGGTMALTGMVVSILLKAGYSAFASVLIALVLGVICGSINGFAVSKGKINPMITTLATMSIFRGIAYLLNDGISIVVTNEQFKWLGRGYVGFIPFLVLVMLLCYIITWYLAKYTAFGRKVYATGSNARASYLSGINTDRVVFIVYLLNGMLAGISGILMAAQTGAGLPTAGTGYEMTIISACILGGTSLSGGKGSLWGSLIGVLMLTTISNGLTMLGIQTFWQQIIKGCILLAAVFIDVLRSGAYKKA
ncbi:MAG TPA: ABC transporter permease [Clostridiales bacterium]|nr:ABC transporter permease [Clostridiales bacterium]